MEQWSQIAAALRAAEPQTGIAVYILECSDGTLYTGWTNDLEARIATHNAGKGAKYTRSRLPAKLVHYEPARTKSEALKREQELKRMTRAQKLKLIKHSQLLANNDFLNTISP
jgi:putative endonuclease